MGPIAQPLLLRVLSHAPTETPAPAPSASPCPPATGDEFTAGTGESRSTTPTSPLAPPQGAAVCLARSGAVAPTRAPFPMGEVGSWGTGLLGSAITCDAFLPNPGAADGGFATREAAHAWALGQIAERGADGGALFEHEGRFYVSTVDVRALQAFTRANVEGSGAPMALSGEPAPLCVITRDGYAIGNGAPHQPGAAALREAAGLARDSGAVTRRGAEALFIAALSAEALARLDANDALAAAEQTRVAAELAARPAPERGSMAPDTEGVALARAASHLRHVREAIDASRASLLQGELPMEAMDVLVPEVAAWFGADRDSARAGDAISRGVYGYVDRRQAQHDAAVKLGTASSLALTVGGLFAGGVPGGVMLAGGTLSGGATAVYEFERAQDLYRAASATAPGGEALVSDVDRAAEDYAWAAANLALAGVDVAGLGKLGAEVALAWRSVMGRSPHLLHGLDAFDLAAVDRSFKQAAEQGHVLSLVDAGDAGRPVVLDLSAADDAFPTGVDLRVEGAAVPRAIDPTLAEAVASGDAEAGRLANTLAELLRIRGRVGDLYDRGMKFHEAISAARIERMFGPGYQAVPAPANVQSYDFALVGPNGLRREIELKGGLMEVAVPPREGFGDTVQAWRGAPYEFRPLDITPDRIDGVVSETRARLQDPNTEVWVDLTNLTGEQQVDVVRRIIAEQSDAALGMLHFFGEAVDLDAVRAVLEGR